MSEKGTPPPERNKRELDLQLDLAERKLEQLRMLYEQYFVDVLPFPPDKQHKEVARSLKSLLKAPFKTSQSRFRLRTLNTRFQTYCTYWERVMKQREEGTYSRDVFKADMREKMLEDIKREMSEAGVAEKGLKQLYNSYEDALKKSGIKSESLNFDSFKQKMMRQAREMKEKHGIKKLSYKVVVKNGKAVIKASAKK